MFKFLNFFDQLINIRSENNELKSKIVKANSDIEYLSMMTDIELDQGDTEEENHDGNV